MCICKMLTFITSVYMGSFKIRNGRNYAHEQDSNIDNFCWSENLTKLIRKFITLLKGNNIESLKIHNGRIYGHARGSNVYNFCSLDTFFKINVR